MGESQVSVREAAIEQLEDSVSLFHQGRYASALTLAGAAEEVLGRMVASVGGDHALSRRIAGALEIGRVLGDSELDEAWVAWRANRARNLLKHWSAENGETLPGNLAEEAADMIERAISNLWRLGVPLSEAMERFPTRGNAP